MTHKQLQSQGWALRRGGDFYKTACYVHTQNKWATKVFTDNPKAKDNYSPRPDDAALDAALKMLEQMQIVQEEKQRQLDMLRQYLKPQPEQKAA